MWQMKGSMKNAGRIEHILDHDPMGMQILFPDIPFLVHLDEEQDMRLSQSEPRP